MPLSYSFDCAGVRFIILNTPDPAIAVEDDPQTSLALAQSKESWLKDQLGNNLSGTFTMHHHPILDNGRTTMNANLELWESLYHAYPISANFAGHTHNYQRYLVGDIPFL
jgi:acid phosphatase type 7